MILGLLDMSVTAVASMFSGAMNTLDRAGKSFAFFDYEGFSAQELRAIANELDRRNEVKDES